MPNRPTTPRAVVARRCSLPKVQVSDLAALGHARTVWLAALRYTLGAADTLFGQLGHPDLRIRAERDLLGGHADLVFVSELAAHLAGCALCYRTHAGGGTPAVILRAMVRHRPMWAVYRPVEIEQAKRAGLARRSA